MPIHTLKDKPRRHAPHWTKKTIQEVHDLISQGVPLENVCEKTGRNMAQINNLIKRGAKIVNCLSCHNDFIGSRTLHICPSCKRRHSDLSGSQYDEWDV